MTMDSTRMRKRANAFFKNRVCGCMIMELVEAGQRQILLKSSPLWIPIKLTVIRLYDSNLDILDNQS
jgi:hypothetical protein